MCSKRVWICLLSSVLPVFSQQVNKAAPAEDRITLDVVVNSKSGIPVTGLQQQDFTVLDNKQSQKILSFEAVSRSSPDPVEVVLIVDAVNTSFIRIATARDQIKRFLRQDNARLSRPLSVDFLEDSGLQIQSSPSTDGNAIITFLDQKETALRTLRRSQGFYGAADRAQLSLRSLEQLADYEVRRPGRKLVIWLSPGWPLLTGPQVQLSGKDQQNIFASIVATSTRLRDAGITLYAVDPLGTADSGGFRTSYYEQFVKGLSSPRQALFGNLALQVLALQSGGRVLNSSNDVAGEIEKCARDANAYYVLSFASRAGDGPNEYHSLEVKLRQSDLKAQTRTGYYAQPVPAPPR